MALDADTLRLRYPAFAAVQDATVVYWIADAARFVDTSWPIEADREPAQLAYAAHRMAEEQVPGLTGNDAASAAAVGLTRWRSGTADMQFSEAAVTAMAAGGLGSTRYGREYLALLQRNKGGGMVTPPGAIGCNAGFNGFAGPLPYPAALFDA